MREGGRERELEKRETEIYRIGDRQTEIEGDR